MPPGSESWDPLARAQWLEMTTLLPGYILASQGDRMLMANSVEGRFPFLDRDVVELANGLPSRHKLLWSRREAHAQAGLRGPGPGGDPPPPQAALPGTRRRQLLLRPAAGVAARGHLAGGPRGCGGLRPGPGRRPVRQVRRAPGGRAWATPTTCACSPCCPPSSSISSSSSTTVPGPGTTPRRSRCWSSTWSPARGAPHDDHHDVRPRQPRDRRSGRGGPDQRGVDRLPGQVHAQGCGGRALRRHRQQRHGRPVRRGARQRSGSSACSCPSASPRPRRLAPRPDAGRLAWASSPCSRTSRRSLDAVGCYRRRDDAIRMVFPEYGPGLQVEDRAAQRDRRRQLPPLLGRRPGARRHASRRTG